MNLNNYYLDIEKLKKLENFDKNFVIDLYYKLTTDNNIIDFNTLTQNGFLVPIKEENIDKILS